MPGVVREKVLQRDGHRCFFCFMTRLQSEHMYGKSLHVHHIDMTGGDVEPNNITSNLVTLCLSCHQKVHAIFNKYLKKDKKKL